SVDGSFLADHEGEPIVVGDEDGTVENAIAGGGQDDGFYLDIDGRSSSKSEIEAFYDQVAAGNYLGIVVGHSQFDETTEERVRFAIREAKARDLEIVTLREALSEHGVGPDEMLGTEEDDEGDDDPEVENGDDEVPTNESVSDSSDDDAGSTVRENGPAIAAGTGLLATVVVAGRAAYRRLVD
ncbi:MAG: polysaccharide deacetylase, partial [Natronococcus sp.]